MEVKRSCKSCQRELFLLTGNQRYCNTCGFMLTVISTSAALLLVLAALFLVK